MGLDLKKRLVTAALLIPVVIYLLSTELGTTFLILLIACVVMTEYRLTLCPALLSKCSPKPSPCNKFSSALFGIIITVVSCLSAAGGSLVSVGKASFLCVIITFAYHFILFRCSPVNPNVSDVLRLTLDLFGVLYISSPFAHAVLIRFLSPSGMGLQIICLMAVWNCDNGALFLGSAFGERRFLRAVSPGKTWAGVLGGLLFSTLTFFAARQLMRWDVLWQGFLPPLSDTQLLIMGLTIGAMGVMGDLVESFLKRAACLKDSGALFPGHGGALDRMDSLLLSAVAMYYLLRAIL